MTEPKARMSLIKPPPHIHERDTRFVCVPSCGAVPCDEEEPFLDNFIHSYEMALTLSLGNLPPGSLWLGRQTGSLYRVITNPEPLSELEAKAELLVGLSRQERDVLIENRAIARRVKLYGPGAPTIQKPVERQDLW